MTVSAISSSCDRQSSEIEYMPRDLIGHIFSYIDEAELQALVGISKKFFSATIQATNVNKRSQLMMFIDNIIRGLDKHKYAEQMACFKQIRSSLRADCLSLVLLKQYIFSVKDQIIDALSKIGQDELSSLEDIPVPSFCENIFLVTKICMRIAPSILISDIYLRESALKDISRALIKAREFARAIEVSKLAPSKVPFVGVFGEISYFLMQVGETSRAIEFAIECPSETYRFFALRDISDFLIKAREFTRAIEVAKRAPNKHGEGHILLSISNALRAKDIPRAIEVAEMIEVIEWKKRALGDISEALVKDGKIGRAYIIAETIPDEFWQRRILYIMDEFSKTGIWRVF